jgi:hypothetical protein
MLSRRNLALAGVLAVVVALNVALEPRGRTVASAAPLLPSFDAARAARVEVARDDAELVLVREPEGWVHDGPGRFAASGYALEELFARLAALSTADKSAADPDSHARLGVDERGTRIVVRDARGDVLASLVQGAVPGGAGSHVRRADQALVVRAAAFAPLGTDATAWIDTTLVSLPPGDVHGLRLRRGRDGLDLELLREPDGTWRCATRGREGTVPRAVVDRLLQAACELVFSDVVAAASPAAVGLDAPRATLSLAHGAERSLALHLGADLDAEHVAVTRGDWDPTRVVALRATTVQLLEAAFDVIDGALR